jgi:hypothetical protein
LRFRRPANTTRGSLNCGIVGGEKFVGCFYNPIGLQQLEATVKRGERSVIGGIVIHQMSTWAEGGTGMQGQYLIGQEITKFNTME